MTERGVRMTYICGPTALLEIGGLRLLTDPTFDPAGTRYVAGAYQLVKTEGPAVPAAAVGRVDVALVSHDHHFDNLDGSGRAFLAEAGRVVTTPAGAERLGGGAVGLAPWESIEVAAPDGSRWRLTGTPARHGPEGGDRGPVTGLVVAPADAPVGEALLYVSGDTVWYDGVAEVARRFAVQVAVLFMGAARVRAVGPAALTMTAADGIQAALALGGAVVAPLHYSGWEHFTESRAEIERAFAGAGLVDRLRWPPPGIATVLAPADAGGAALPEPWLRGPLAGVDPLLAPILRSFEQVREDLARWTSGLTDEQVWSRPRGLAPLGFQLRHIAGSLDRLTTYLEGRPLAPRQLATLTAEMEPGDGLAQLLAEVDAALERAAAVVRELDPARLRDPREVGRARLPTSVIGLAVHLAEHTQRHLGQAIVTAKLARGDRGW